MEAVLLAGGFGTRLRPLTYTRPKPLLPVGGRPMLEWVLDRLPAEVTKVIVAVNWQAERLEKYFANADHPFETMVVRESEPLGTAGAVQNCAEHLTSDRFFVLNADIVSDMDLEGQLQQHIETGAKGTISVKEVPLEDVVNFGVIAPHDDDPRRIQHFVEKPKDPKDAPSRLINAGAYLLERSVLELIPKGEMVSMEKDIFPQLLATGLYGHRFDGTWIDVGDPTRLRLAAAHVSDQWHGVDAAIAPTARVRDSVAGVNLTVGEAATIERCVIGDNVTIAPEALLRDCVIGDNETVDADAEGVRIWTQERPAGYPNKQVGNAL